MSFYKWDISLPHQRIPQSHSLWVPAHSSSKGTWDIQRRHEVSGIRARANTGQISRWQKCWQKPFFFSEPSWHRAGRWVAYVNLQQHGYHCLPHPGGGWPWPAPPRRIHRQHSIWVASDQVKETHSRGRQCGARAPLK